VAIYLGSTVPAKHNNGNVNARICYAPFSLIIDDPIACRIKAIDSVKERLTGHRITLGDLSPMSIVTDGPTQDMNIVATISNFLHNRNDNEKLRHGVLLSL